MKLIRPKQSCQNTTRIQKDGRFFRKNDSKYIQRYRCAACGKRFSSAINSSRYRQKKRTVNHLIEKLYCSKVSIRRIAKILKIDKKTVMRKIAFLGEQAKLHNKSYLKKKSLSPVKHLQFDDLITKEKTKMLPLSITAAVDAQTREILAIKVSKIPAFGLLAQKSRKKYGKRKFEHKKNLDKLLEELRPLVQENPIINTDDHKLYPELIQKHFKGAQHERFKGAKGSVTAQGELKKVKRDPLFAINHTFAMMRDNISRLVRRSWCITQKIEMLEHHLQIYMKYHNTELII